MDLETNLCLNIFYFWPFLDLVTGSLECGMDTQYQHRRAVLLEEALKQKFPSHPTKPFRRCDYKLKFGDKQMKIIKVSSMVKSKFIQI